MSQTYEQIVDFSRKVGFEFTGDQIGNCHDSGATAQEFLPIVKRQARDLETGKERFFTRDEISAAWSDKKIDFTSDNLDACLKCGASPDEFAPIARRQAAERSAMQRLEAANQAEAAAKAKRSQNFRKKYSSVFDGGITI